MAQEPTSRGSDYVVVDSWNVVLDSNELFRDFRLTHPETSGLP
jgi:hypothetical protein